MLIRRLGRRLSNADPGKVRAALAHLGLAENATPEEVRRQFAKICKKMHPDVTGQSSSKEFTKLMESYLYLKQTHWQPTANQRYKEESAGEEAVETEEFLIKEVQDQISREYFRIFGTEIRGNCEAFFEAPVHKQRAFVNFVELCTKRVFPNTFDFDFVFPMHSRFRNSTQKNEAEFGSKNHHRKHPSEDNGTQTQNAPSDIGLGPIALFGLLGVLVYYFSAKKEHEYVADKTPKPAQPLQAPKQTFTSAPPPAEPAEPAEPQKKEPFRVKPKTFGDSSVRKFRLQSNLNDFVIWHSIAREVEFYVAKDKSGLTEAYKALSSQIGPVPNGQNFVRVTNNSYAGTINVSLAAEMILRNILVPIKEVKRQISENGFFQCPVIHFYHNNGNFLFRVDRFKPMNKSVDFQTDNELVSLFSLYFTKASDLVYLCEFAGDFKISKLFEIRGMREINGLISLKPGNFKKMRLNTIDYSRPLFYDIDGLGRRQINRPTDWKYYTNMNFKKLLQLQSRLFNSTKSPHVEWY